MKDAVVRALGISASENDVVILVFRDGLEEEEISQLDPVLEALTDELGATIVAFPESVFLDIKVLGLHQLLELRSGIDEAIASKMSATNVGEA